MREEEKESWEKEFDKNFIDYPGGIYCRKTNKPAHKEDIMKVISKAMDYCGMDLEKNKPKWEKEFDKFISDNEVRWEGSNVGDVKYTAIPLLKIFISALLDSQLKEVLGVIESVRPVDNGTIRYHESYNDGKRDLADEVKAEVEKLV